MKLYAHGTCYLYTSEHGGERSYSPFRFQRLKDLSGTAIAPETYEQVDKPVSSPTFTL